MDRVFPIDHPKIVDDETPRAPRDSMPLLCITFVLTVKSSFRMDAILKGRENSKTLDI
jgi:hypothetical protein